MQNPYDVWSAPSSSRQSSDIPPSIYGALPYTNSPVAPGSITFHFARLNPSILNSVVLGPDNCPKFHIVTESSMPGYTILKAVDGGNIGMIQWKPDDSQIEIRGIMHKRAARDFLRLSDDNRCRIMCVRGKDYIWISEQDCTCMYLGGDVSSKIFAKLTRDQSCFRLVMAAEAISAGLLPSAILAIILIQSGKA
ncbi:uncharacterized protein BT62DRAFT_879514 [Guyanagaster necrorhizus]|uniref:Uncharacterized protein n=1 Tax=Guyanagaster necrorhizus TaxID=856835 RepID=A0A9P7W5W4_9AGAR|nr:uncharacterized protein BT62DRAFT_879514 [Guyanagaster necrorhizus MCA 3950]KAG7453238.1 hypothetical protein BT62DRAFT_879514 [Guyanagaster necrorhizus MCA 3950]